MKRSECQIGLVCTRNKTNIEWVNKHDFYKDKSKLVIILTDPYPIVGAKGANYFVKIFCLSDCEIRQIYINRIDPLPQFDLSRLSKDIIESYEKAKQQLDISMV